MKEEKSYHFVYIGFAFCVIMGGIYLCNKYVDYKMTESKRTYELQLKLNLQTSKR